MAAAATAQWQPTRADDLEGESGLAVWCLVTGPVAVALLYLQG